jgi:hypothetical protein
LAISSISSAGSNLVLNAVVPAEIDQVTVEMCPALGEPWEELARMNIQAGMGEVAFTVAKPNNSLALFRLTGRRLQSAPLVSAQVPYVTIAPLGTDRPAGGDAVFHFKGAVDGSDRIVITREGASWSHVNWGWPAEDVTVNGAQWRPDEKNFLTSPAGSKFLPEEFSLQAAHLEVTQGRDVVALERGTNSLTVLLDDTPVGADVYDFAIHFGRATPTTGAGHGATARLKVAARIDGSDCIRITRTEATWTHQAWSGPRDVMLNDMQWDPEQAKVLKNEGATRFLPRGVDFSTARILARKGRDLATMWSDKDGLSIWFADNANGDDAYELEIAFGE